MQEPRVCLSGLRGRRLDADAVAQCRFVDQILESLAAAAPAKGEDERRPVTRTDDDVRRPARAVEEVPGPQRNLLTFDEQEALAHQHEEALLVPLPVVEAHRLAGQEPVDVDPELPEWPLALEVAVRT